MKKLITILFLVLAVANTESIKAQEIVNVEYRSSIIPAVARLLTTQLGLTIDIDYATDLYIVQYTTTGSDMMPDTASGLFMIPSGVEGPLPLMVYQHGTTDGRFDVPSRLGAAYQLGVLFSGKGMAVLAPDFLGMGDSRGFHPYVHAETEATAAIDMLAAMKTFLKEQEIEYTDQLFLTGYSQGGHAAMALHEYIETEIPDELTVTASLPMSGPYSISGVMRDVAYSDEEFFFPSYLVYSTRGLKEIYPDLYDSEAQIFKAPYLPAIEEFVSTGENLGDLNTMLVSELINQNGKSVTRDLFRDSVLTVFESMPDHPFNLALAESDVFDWTPQAPVLMTYCPSDDQVPFRNSIVADSVMNARGAAEVSAEDVSGGQDLDHGQCAIPALNRGVPWIFSFVKDNTTSTIETDLTAGLQVFPTVASDKITITTDTDIHRVSLYNLAGRQITSLQPNSNYQQLDVSNVRSGMYVITINTAAGLSTAKVIVE